MLRTSLTEVNQSTKTVREGENEHLASTMVASQVYGYASSVLPHRLSGKYVNNNKQDTAERAEALHQFAAGAYTNAIRCEVI